MRAAHQLCKMPVPVHRAQEEVSKNWRTAGTTEAMMQRIHLLHRCANCQLKVARDVHRGNLLAEDAHDFLQAGIGPGVRICCCQRAQSLSRPDQVVGFMTAALDPGCERGTVATNARLHSHESRSASLVFVSGKLNSQSS